MPLNVFVFSSLSQTKKLFSTSLAPSPARLLRKVLAWQLLSPSTLPLIKTLNIPIQRPPSDVLRRSVVPDSCEEVTPHPVDTDQRTTFPPFVSFTVINSRPRSGSGNGRRRRERLLILSNHCHIGRSCVFYAKCVNCFSAFFFFFP